MPTDAKAVPVLTREMARDALQLLQYDGWQQDHRIAIYEALRALASGATVCVPAQQPAGEREVREALEWADGERIETFAKSQVYVTTLAAEVRRLQSALATKENKT